MTRGRWRGVLIGLLAVLAGTSVLAQRGGYSRGSYTANVKYDGRFVFVRMSYPDSFSRRGPFWAHDYPRGEEHFLKILSELTSVATHVTESSVMSWSDSEVFKFPVVYMCEPGYFTLSGDAEVKNFRAYLQKGGFLILDDFRGNDWGYMEQQVARAFPEGRWVDLDAQSPVFHAFFEIESLDIIPQAYDNGRPRFRGMYEDNDPRKRLMIVAAYNTDISEFWEWSDTGLKPIDESNEAYKLGVNYIIYGMTH